MGSASNGTQVFPPGTLEALLSPRAGLLLLRAASASVGVRVLWEVAAYDLFMPVAAAGFV